MWFAVITLFPEMFDVFTKQGIAGRAVLRGQADVVCINPRDFTNNPYRRIDERPFGGGPGMVMMAEPLAAAIKHAKALSLGKQLKEVPVVYLSPQGHLFSEKAVHQLKQYDGIIFLCGRYEGVDERLLEKYVDQEWSIGDYVLTGGELPAMVMMDSLIRRLPDVMSDVLSAEQDSFVDGLLDCPHYTKPDVFEGLDVPAVLKTGHHAEIKKWRFMARYMRTSHRRPELLKSATLNEQQLKWVRECNKKS